MTDADLPLLRILGLKGMADAAVVGGALRSSGCEARLQALVEQGLARQLPRGFALTPAGREVLRRALAAEHSVTDAAGMTRIYEEFCGINAAFKSLMHAWQIRQVDGVEVANDHADAAYDAAIVERLGAIDESLRPLLSEIVALAPRLAPYPARFTDALAGLRAGDASMMARPLVDSYHTVWFELHEDLIALSGTTRAAEAAAGRGD